MHAPRHFLLRITVLVGLLTNSAVSAHPGPGIAADAKGNIYFVDFTRDRILKIDNAGKTEVFADGAQDHQFSVPHHLSCDAAGNLYTAGDRDGKIVRIAPNGTITQLYPPPNWYGLNFLGSGGDPVAVDAAGNLYGVNRRQQKFLQILRIDTEGRIHVLAGGRVGQADGRGAEAQFEEPVAMTFAVGAQGTLFVSESTRIRSVSVEGVVTTLAGGAEAGNRDGRGNAARFMQLAGINLDSKGHLLVADHGAGTIRRVDSQTGDATTPLPSAALQRLGVARPVGVAGNAQGILFVLDYPAGDDARVTRFDPDGTAGVLCPNAGQVK